ncbi:hypothetical protein Tco_0994388 [Tanacetum coccineum]
MRMCILFLRNDGNSWNSGLAPPSPPGTPTAAGGFSRNHQPRSNNPSTCGPSRCDIHLDAITLKPPPMDHHKSFDDDGFSAIPIAPKKVCSPLEAVSNSLDDLQLAKDRFCAGNLIGEGSTGCVFMLSLKIERNCYSTPTYFAAS